MLTEFSVRFTTDRLMISLLERSQNVHERILRLRIDRHDVGELSFLPMYPPGIGVGKAHVVIWANTDLYIVNRETFALTQFNQDEPVIAAFPIDHRWCLVREISVVMADVDHQLIEAKINHDEIILEAWWVENSLFVEDLEQRQLSFAFSQTAPFLRLRAS